MLKLNKLLFLGTVVALTLSACSKDDGSEDHLKGVSCFAGNPLLLERTQQSNSPNSDETLAAQSNGEGDSPLARVSARSEEDFAEDIIDKFGDKLLLEKLFLEKVTRAIPDRQRLNNRFDNLFDD